LLVLGTSADRADEVSSINAVTTTATVGTVASGFSVNDVRAATALSGHMVDLDLYIQRSGATITASGGNIADTLMFTLAAAYRPSHIRSAVWGNGTVSGEAIIDTDGSVTLRSANGSITSGSNVRLASCYLRN
jgi:hypothetical protein